MGFYQTLKIFTLILFFLLPLISFTCPQPPPPSSSSTKVQQANAPPNLFYIKNTTPIFLDKQALNTNVKRKRMIIKRKKHHRLDSRAFSAMLPKGFVPPSGSSPCHNDQPNSVTFFCELSKEVKP